ncbi:MAG: hypothetical protein EXQ95_03230 [Alphaproteobacteria bacterium]|nr:hypothetical protein [Alphaproteobacteria bacterium]
MTPSALHIAWAPLLPIWALAALGVAALVVVGLGLAARARGAWWRTGAALALLAALANPTLVAERREARPDVAVLVVDESPSQKIGTRLADTRRAAEQLAAKLAALPGVELRTVTVGGNVVTSDDGTRLATQLDKALADVPRHRLAGIAVVTDGQVHDLPPEGVRDLFGAPLHVLLTGQRGEADRRLVIEKVPTYGLVGKPITLSIRVEDAAVAPGTPVQLTLRRDGAAEQRQSVPVGRTVEIPLTLDHGGQTVIELAVEPGPKELTLDNNRAVAAINGVRDRLRVLLVSGEPHAGERTWRSLLKADPAVDLVHFTILRPPEKQDGTPIRELSLIAFPIRELFEIKLDEFNLIIFDRYRRQGILPRANIANIADYIEKGGALLDATGPPFAGSLSLYRTPLGRVMPAEPTGQVVEQGFKPMLSPAGHRHPVTSDLPGGAGAEPGWGRWFRYIDAEAQRGEVVMQGPNARPLLILDRVGKGRVAQLMSDHIWLWTRGFEGGGPQAELLRRLAHWLMKEPELEENVLSAQLRGDRLEVKRRSVKPDDRPVTVTLPNGETASVAMAEDGSGGASGDLAVDQVGLYRLGDGQRTAIAAVGPLNPLEWADVRATGAKLAPFAQASGGSVNWLQDGTPEPRKIRPGRPASGRDWIGFRTNGDYATVGLDEVALMPALLVLAMALGMAMVAWRREGK